MTRFPFSFRKFSTLLFFILFISNLIAQSGTKQSLSSSFGVGISGTDDETGVGGIGIHVQVEYAFALKNWFDIRPYVGGLFTAKLNIYSDEAHKYGLSNEALLAGVRGRFTAPIPWFAPYLEIGVGGSAGSFVTYSPATNIEKNGLQLHIPFTIGVSLGSKRNVDLAFLYYFHPAAEQVNGIANFGITFQIN